MNIFSLKPGSLVVTNFGVYQHWSIVSDRIDNNKKPYLISASRRTGTVKEELWDTVTQGNKTEVVTSSEKLNTKAILSRAKAKIDSWKYDVIARNCEHFVNWVAYEELTSKQVTSASVGFVSGVTLYSMLTKTSRLSLALTIGVGLGALAVYFTKPSSRKL